MRDVFVALPDGLAPGTMREVAVPGGPVLLVRRDDGALRALGARCPHAQAPLAKGVLCGDRVVCPWHHGVFRVEDGALLDPPPLDRLPRYGVREEVGGVVLTLPEGELPGAAPPATVTRNGDARLFAILGAGAAGALAAETLREAGFRGRVVLIGREEMRPYDRTQLSKMFLSGQFPSEKLPLRDADHYARLDIEVLDRPVQRVLGAARRLQFEDGGTLDCDAILLAPGGEPRRLQVPGDDAPNVRVLRSFDDALRLVETLENGARGVVILGGGFIGMEAASSLRQRNVDVTVASPDALPLAKQLSEPVARWLLELHRAQGTEFRLGVKPAAFELGPDGCAVAVLLEDGTRLDGALFLVGAGVAPNTGMVDGIALQHGAVPVDRCLRTAAPGVFAAGDVALVPDARTNEPIRVEHWRVAAQHGRVAALNMAGIETPFEGVPFFWTAQCNKRISLVGHAAEWERVAVAGDLAADGEFMAFLVRQGRVAAAVAVGFERDMAALHELFRIDAPPRCDGPGGLPESPSVLLRRSVHRADASEHGADAPVRGVNASG